MAMATFAKRLHPLAAHYRNNDPFPHIAIDGHFHLARIRQAAREVTDTATTLSPECYAQQGKRGQTDRNAMGPVTRGLFDELNSPAFLRWLESLTGIDNLIADPALYGGGIHRTGRGGFLKIHADFSWYERLKLYRRINVLLYLNEGWRDEWGGHLELWDCDMKGPVGRVAPVLGRMVVFNTDADSFHGHPEPLACPEDVSRNSLALYYYTAEPTQNGRRSTMTDFRERPAERFRGPRRLVHRMKIAANF
jgi:hypothetical protein